MFDHQPHQLGWVFELNIPQVVGEKVEFEAGDARAGDRSLVSFN